MRQANNQFMTNVSMGADAASNPILMKQEMAADISIKWSGSPVGDFTVETCNQPGQINPATGLPSGLDTWDTYPDSTHAAGGAANSFTYHLNVLPSGWVRLKYTRTSGSGTILWAIFNAKGVV